MEFYKKVLKGMAYNGVVLGVGVLGLYLCNRRYIPDYMGPISYGITWFGFCVSSAYFLGIQRRDSTDEKPKDETARLIATQILDALQPALEKQLAEQAAIRKEMKKAEMKHLVDGWEEQSKKLAESLSRYSQEAKPNETERREDSSPDEEELTDFKLLLDEVDLAEAVKPEMDDSLKSVEKSLESRDEGATASLFPMEYFSGDACPMKANPELYAQLEKNPELWADYEREVSNMLRHAFADAESNLEGAPASPYSTELLSGNVGPTAFNPELQAQYEKEVSNLLRNASEVAGQSNLEQGAQAQPGDIASEADLSKPAESAKHENETKES